MSESTDHAAKRMRISLVIPVRDEEETIEELLASIAAQTRPPDETLFVDGGSSDRTVARLQAAGLKDSSIRVIEAGIASPGQGRNVGIAAARYEWIALTDAGIRLETTWLERLASRVERDSSLGIVYGNYEPITETFFQRCAALLYSHYRQLRDGHWMRGPFIASSMMRRDVWEKVGGFPDLRASEDLIFMERVAELGIKTGWAADATVRWHPQPTLLGTFRRSIIFSRFNVWAGRQRHWHYGVARAYLLSLPFIVLGFLHSFWWLFVPLAILLARAAKSIWLRRDGRGLLWLLNPLQFFGVALMLLVIDVATLIGWMQALWRARPPSNASQPNYLQGSSNSNKGASNS